MGSRFYLCPRCETDRPKGYICPKCSEKLLFVLESDVGSAIDIYRNSGVQSLSDLLVTEEKFLEDVPRANSLNSAKKSSRNKFLWKASLILFCVGLGANLARPHIKNIYAAINVDHPKITRAERAVYDLYAQQAIAISPEEVNRALAPERQMTKIRQKAVFAEVEKKIIGQVVNWHLAVAEIRKVNEFEARIETVRGVVDHRDGYEKTMNDAADIIGMLGGVGLGIVGQPYYKSKYSNGAIGTTIALTIRSPDDWVFLERLQPGQIINVQGKVVSIADGNLVELKPAVLHSPENLSSRELISKKLTSRTNSQPQ